MSPVRYWKNDNKGIIKKSYLKSDFQNQNLLFQLFSYYFSDNL